MWIESILDMDSPLQLKIIKEKVSNYKEFANIVQFLNFFIILKKTFNFLKK